MFFLKIVWLLLCQACFHIAGFFVLFGLLRIAILLSNQHVLLLHYEEAGKQTFESLRMT